MFSCTLRNTVLFRIKILFYRLHTARKKQQSFPGKYVNTSDDLFITLNNIIREDMN